MEINSFQGMGPGAGGTRSRVVRSRAVADYKRVRRGMPVVMELPESWLHQYQYFGSDIAVYFWRMLPLGKRGGKIYWISLYYFYQLHVNLPLSQNKMFNLKNWCLQLLHLEWINNKVLLYSTGNYIQSSGRNHNGKEYFLKMSLCV